MDDHISRIEAALKDEPTPGPWMHLFGDRIIYTVLEDGCRGRPVAAVDHLGWEGSYFNLNYIAACNPVAIRALLDRLKAAEAENEQLRDALKAIAAYRTGGRIEGLCRAALENTNG